MDGLLRMGDLTKTRGVKIVADCGTDYFLPILCCRLGAASRLEAEESGAAAVEGLLCERPSADGRL